MSQQTGLSVWPEGHCLLSELCQHLLAEHSHNLEHIVVVLPTQRLSTCLLAMLAQRLQTFIPPQLYTIEQFLAVYGSSATADYLLLSDLSQELVLSALLREKKYRHLKPGHEHELKQFFNDLCEHKLEEQAFARLADSLLSEVHRDEAHCQDLLARFEEIADVHGRWQAALTNKKALTSMQAMRLQCHFLARVWHETSLPWPHLYLACFTTLKAFIRPLLQVLAGSQQCSLWFNQPPRLLAKLNPLSELIKALTPQTQKQPAGLEPYSLPALPLPAKSEPNRAKLCYIHPCPHTLAEVAAALAQAQQHIQQGCPPSAIAILMTCEATYGKILRHMLAQLDWQANVAVSTPLGQTPLGSWILALIGLWEEKPDENQTSDVLTFFLHPLTQYFLARQNPALRTALLPSDAAHPSPLQAELRQALRNLKSELSWRELPRQVQEPELRAALAQLLQVFDPLYVLGLRQGQQGMRSPLREWLEAFEGLLEQMGVWEHNFGEDSGVAQSSVSAFADLMQALTEAASLHPTFVSQGEFWRLIKDKMLSLETRSIGYPLKGLQVLSLIEARYIPFQVLIILGCNEGKFPKALPKDHLIADWFKSQIGLPAWHYVEALEDTTFQLLRARIPQINLFYSEQSHDTPQVRSRYIEKLLGENSGLMVAGDREEELWQLFGSEDFEVLRAAYCEKLAARGAAKGWPAQAIRPHFAEFSATSLESLLHCPYQFLLKKLGVARLRATELHDPAAEGQFLHKILEAFFTGQNQSQQLCEAFPTKVAKASFASWAEARLSQLSAAILPKTLHYGPVKIHLQEFSWPRFIAHLASLAPVEADQLCFPEYRLCEWPLGQREGVKIAATALFPSSHLTIDPVVKGTIDRVDSSDEGWHVVWDYKRKNLPSLSAVEQGANPQLGLYALALENDPFFFAGGFRSAQACLAYWSILDGKALVVGVGDSARPALEQRGLVSRKTPPLSRLHSALQARWEERLNSFIEREKLILPETGQACTFCDYAGICRRHDPSNSRPLTPQPQAAALSS